MTVPHPAVTPGSPPLASASAHPVLLPKSLHDLPLAVRFPFILSRVVLDEQYSATSLRRLMRLRDTLSADLGTLRVSRFFFKLPLLFRSFARFPTQSSKEKLPPSFSPPTTYTFHKLNLSNVDSPSRSLIFPPSHLLVYLLSSPNREILLLPVSFFLASLGFLPVPVSSRLELNVLAFPPSLSSPFLSLFRHFFPPLSPASPFLPLNSHQRYFCHCRPLWFSAGEI